LLFFFTKIQNLQGYICPGQNPEKIQLSGIGLHDSVLLHNFLESKTFNTEK